MCNIGNTHTHDRRADWLDMPGMQPPPGGFLMKPDIGAIADVLSDVLELIEMLRNDVLHMLEDLEG